MIDFLELPKDGIKFEQFVRELLIRSDFDVHWTGVGPDGGRDLTFVEKVEGKLAPFERKWLVSCKHFATSGRSVGIDDVSDIVDACKAVDASGYLLACSTQPSASVVKRFEELESRGNIIIKSWDAIELEKRLYTPKTFPIISLFFPITSKSLKWQIFNTNSPAFWAANYKDYFLYLSSRTATTFPTLKDVEEIVNRIESIKLPEGDTWDHHYIRPRAVYFDNKHEQFSVFADYLYTKKTEDKLIMPHAINEVLRDGMGLYSEDGAMWYITNWDIRYICTNQISDGFHLDHQEYYKPFMRNFTSGMARSSFISEMY